MELGQMRTVDAARFKAVERIKKVGENHGIIEKVLKDADGADVVVVEFEFGNDYVTQELAAVDARLAVLTAKDYLQNEIAVLQEKRSKLIDMQKLIEVKDGTTEVR